MDMKKKIYHSISAKDPDLEVIKPTVIKATENSTNLSQAYQEAAQHKMIF